MALWDTIVFFYKNQILKKKKIYIIIAENECAETFFAYVQYVN